MLARASLIITISTLTVLFGSLSWAEGEPMLSLQEAIYLALRFNPDVQNQEIQRVVDKYNLRVAQNRFELQYALQASVNQTSTRRNGSVTSSRNTTVTPALSYRGNYGTEFDLRMNNPTTEGNSITGSYNPGVDLGIKQPLLRGFGKEVTLTPLYDAEDREVIQQLQYKDVLMRTLQQVIRDYRGLIQSQNNVVTSQLALDSYKKTVAMTKAQIKAGRSAPSEVLQAESNYANQLVINQNNENRVINDRLGLMDTIGLMPETKFQVPSDVEELRPEVPDFEKSFKIALDSNVAYRRSLYEIEIVKRALVVAKDNARASLNMRLRASSGNGSGTRPNSGLESLTNRKNSELAIGFDLEVPIDDYQLRQGILNAKIRLQQANIQLAAQKRELKTTIMNDIADIRFKLKQIDLAKRALKIQINTQKALDARLRHGLVSTFEVTQTQQDLNQARERLISSKIDYLNAYTQFYVDMGVLLDKWRIDVYY